MNKQSTIKMNSSSVILPNIILTFASIYFIFVILEDLTSASYFRKIFYYILLICDVSTLIYINSDYYIFKKIHTSLIQYFDNLFYNKEFKKKEVQDEIKNFVE